MKKIIFLAVFAAVTSGVFAQQEYSSDNYKKSSWFKKENMFTGGTIALGFSSQYTNVGASPYLGYSLNKYLDVAAVLNFNYTVQRDIQNYGDRLRQTVMGPGAFMRVFPIDFLFLQAQYEYNLSKVKYLGVNNIGNQTYNDGANSLLLGAGYCYGRTPGNNTYGYVAVLWDVLGNEGSPYLDAYNRPVPVLKAGINIALFQHNSRADRQMRNY
jgi:hypothetical protein